MDNSYQRSSRSKWDCENCVVFVRQYCRKALYGDIGLISPEVAKQKECQITEGLEKR
jgi:hypothetical protein